MKKYIVVAYDITSDKRRDKICDLLSTYGKRVNYSVFECFLRERDIRALKDEMEKHLNKREDTVLFYYLCRDCVGKIERVGKFCDERRVVKVI